MIAKASALTLRHRGRDLRLSSWFRDSGDDLLLFVHGLGCSKESWRRAWSVPSLYGRSLLAFDLPGFGASHRPADFTHDLAEQAGLVAAIIDAHASRRISLIAHSMGGTIAALLPETAMRRLDRLILVEARLLHESCSVSAEVDNADRRTFETKIFPDFRRRVAVDRRSAFDLDRADLDAFYLCSRSLLAHTSGGGLMERWQAFTCPKAFVYGSDNRHLAELAVLEPACRPRDRRRRALPHERQSGRVLRLADTPDGHPPMNAPTDPSASPDSLTRLERAVLETALGAASREEAGLRRQLGAAAAATRTPSGVGFMTRLTVPESLAVPQRPQDETLPIVVGAHPALPSGAEFVVQVKAGRLHTIEAYCFEGMWPGDESAFRLSAGP